MLELESLKQSVIHLTAAFETWTASYSLRTVITVLPQSKDQAPSLKQGRAHFDTARPLWYCAGNTAQSHDFSLTFDIFALVLSFRLSTIIQYVSLTGCERRCMIV